MKRKHLLRVLESCAFLLLLSVMLVSLSGLLERKKSRDIFGGFLEEPQLYDVLFFGDSRMMNAVSPIKMWEEYGIASYNLSSYGGSPALSYWMLMNALDYAQPELVVIAASGMEDAHKAPKYSSDLHMAMDFWPLTRNKVRAIWDLLDDPEEPDFKDGEGNIYRDLKAEFLFPLIKYHSRWSQLKAEDWKKRPDHVKGGESLVGLYPIWAYEFVDESDYAEEIGYAYAYLRKAIEACQSRGIDVVLLNPPHPTVLNFQRHAHTVGSIAEEYGIDFVDVTDLDSIVDYVTDCYDIDLHLNLSGTQKMTSFMGSYLREHYHLPNRHKEAKYAHWHEQLDAYKNEKIRTLAEEKELNHVLMLLHDPDFDVSLALYPSSSVYADEMSIVLMHNIAREHVLAGEEYAKASCTMFPLAGFDEALYEEKPYYLHRRGKTVTEYTGDRAEQATLETFGMRGDSTLLIRVTDRRNGTVVAQKRY